MPGRRRTKLRQQARFALKPGPGRYVVLGGAIELEHFECDFGAGLKIRGAEYDRKTAPQLVMSTSRLVR